MAFSLILFFSNSSYSQAVPYARTFPHAKEEVDAALKDLEAYSGRKLPIVDGFVSMGQQPLNRFEKAFYQYSIDLLPDAGGGTVVRLTAKITAWYADADPAKSGYQVLPSSGRLELDLLDRLTEKFEGKSALAGSHLMLQAPRPKLDLGSSQPPALSPRSTSSSGTVPTTGGATGSPEAEEVVRLRSQREMEEKKMLELKSEIESLKEIQHHQAHPRNLVIITKSGTPILTRPEEGSKVLFVASENDEFEFIEVEGEWFHVQISGASRGWIRRARAEAMDPRWNAAPSSSPAEEKAGEVFRVTKEENAKFPGDWAPLLGKMVKIYWVQPAASPAAATAAREKREFTKSLFQRAWNDPNRAQNEIAGVVVLFDTSDGGQVSATVAALQQWIEGNGSEAVFWQKCSIDPLDLFKN